jgi:hypothetical protein
VLVLYVGRKMICSLDEDLFPPGITVSLMTVLSWIGLVLCSLVEDRYIEDRYSDDVLSINNSRFEKLVFCCTYLENL